MPASRRSLALAALALAAILGLSAAQLSIDQFGAVRWTTTREAALTNGKALAAAIAAADAEPAGSPNTTVVVPPNANYTFIPAEELANLTDVTLSIQGTLVAYALNQTLWPAGDKSKDALNVLQFRNCTNLEVNGGDESTGLIDGQGYTWWWSVLLGAPDRRPHLLTIDRCVNCKIMHLRLINSPQYHIFLQDVLHFEAGWVTIWVDVFAQQSALAAHGKLSTGGSAWRAAMIAAGRGAELPAVAENLDEDLTDPEALWMPAGLPTFPLNTDGIDPAGRDVWIHDIDITNYDDVIAVKPTSGDNLARGVAGDCSQDMLIERAIVHAGVGMSIGSVPPHENTNCIRNITFRNVTYTNAIKAIYIKPNPGTNGDGIIDSITYENLQGTGTLWWTIYVGLQQQKQPGTVGTGCDFLYPLNGTQCPLQPRVPVTNLILRNVHFTNSLLSPGIARCANKTEGEGVQGYAPCTGWEWTNVTVTSLTNWPIGPGPDHKGAYLCHGLYDPKYTNVTPLPVCSP